MKLDEAIEVLEREHEGYTAYPKRVLGEAERLGIEALKRLQAGRKVDHAFAQGRLPSETED